MLAENYELIETLVMNVALLGLFLLMGYAIHDVLSKNDVPLIGRIVAYGVMFLGAVGFLAKGIIQLFFTGSGVAG
jgi:quinol-cytochrome oxidoreductase complex cytochrome b subunit